MIGEKEKVVDNEGAQVFHSKTPSGVGHLHEFKNAFHELQKEPHIKEELHMRVLDFMSSILTDKSKLKAIGHIKHSDLKLGKLQVRKPLVSIKTISAIFVLIIVIVQYL